jgi:hypothetical protein
MDDFRKKLSAKLFQEVLETVARAQQSQVEGLRNADLLRCYAELQFRLNGSAHCSICRATVRHKVRVTVERSDGRVDQYECLCTRCYEGERAQSRKIVMQVGEARVEQGPRERSVNTIDFKEHAARQSNRS